MPIGQTVFIILCLILLVPITVLGLSLFTPATREMIPPVLSIGGLFVLGGIIFGAGYYLLPRDGKL